MAREYDLKPAPSDMADAVGGGATSINRRQFLRYGFNTAAGVLTASLGMLGLPPFSSPRVAVAVAILPSNSGPKAVRTKPGTAPSIFSP